MSIPVTVCHLFLIRVQSYSTRNVANQTKIAPCSEVLPENVYYPTKSKLSLNIMGPEVSLLCSKETAYCPCPEPNKRSQNYSSFFFRSVLMLSSKLDPGFFELFIHLGFSHHSPVYVWHTHHLYHVLG